MALPDVVVNILGAPTSRTLPTDTGQAFVVGTAERGPITKPYKLLSVDDFVPIFGARQTTSVLYDWLETFFAEGGKTAWVGRVLNADGVAATRNLVDSGAGVSLVVTAGYLGEVDKGTWGNSLKVAVLAVSGGFQIQVVRTISAVDVIVETSYTLADQAAAITWAKNFSKYVVITLGATALVPVAAAAAALSTGSNGTGVADADWALALDRFNAELGPGQVTAPGRTTGAGGLQLLAHAVLRKRFALVDGADTATAATLVSAAQALYAAPNNGRRWGQLLAPWDVIPGLTAGTTRTVPPSARQAAQYAVVDALGNPNQPAAGRFGTARYVLDLSQPAWTDADRQLLNEAGVTISRRRYGSAVVTYGLRTLADQIADVNWSQASNVRCVMAYAAQAAVVSEGAQFVQIDGQGHQLGEFRGGLIDKANVLFGKGALYGETPQEAFYVDVGEALNTDTTLANGELHARVALRTSPAPERVIIDVVKTPITTSLV